MKKILIILFFSLFLISCVSAASWNSSTNIYENDSSQTFSTSSITDNTEQYCQTFTIGTTGNNTAFNITSVKWKFARRGSDNSSVFYWYLKYTNTTGAPQPTNISTGQLNYVQVDGGISEYKYYEVNMSNFRLNSSITYALCMRIDSGTFFQVYSGASVYSGGSMWYQGVGTGFANQAVNDLGFEIYGYNSTSPNLNSNLLVNLTSPSDNYNTTNQSVLFSFNVTPTNLNLSNVTLHVFYINGTLYFTNFTTLSGNISQNTTLSATLPPEVLISRSYTWNVKAEGFNTTGSQIGWGINKTIIINTTNTQVYNTTVYETQSTLFSITIYYNSSDVLTSPAEAIFNYDNVNYTTTKSVGLSSITFSTQNFNIPAINYPINKTFYWMINYSGNILQTDKINQTVNNLVLIVCNGTYNTQALNLTLYDETNQTNVYAPGNLATILMNFKYWIGDGTIFKNYSFQNLSSSVGTYYICISPNVTLNIDSDISFSAVNYVENDYHLRNYQINNISQTILLYLLPSVEAQKFYNQVQQGVAFLSGVTVQVEKYFIGLGVWKVVAIKFTDNDGKFPMYMDLDSNYRFTVEDNSGIVGVVNKTAVCAATPCSLLIRISGESGDAFKGYIDYYSNNTLSNIVYNKATKIVTYTFNDTTNMASHFRLVVRMASVQSSESIVCDNYSYSNYGTLTCNMTGLNGSFIATGYIARSPEKVDPTGVLGFVVSEDVLDNLGLDGIFLVMGLLITLIFGVAVISKGSPTAIIVSFGVAVLALKIIGLLPFSWVLISTLEVIIIYLMIKLKV